MARFHIARIVQPRVGRPGVDNGKAKFLGRLFCAHFNYADALDRVFRKRPSAPFSELVPEENGRADARCTGDPGGRSGLGKCDSTSTAGSRKNACVTLPRMREVRIIQAGIGHADPAGVRSFGALTPFSFAIRARNGRQRHGIPFAAHLYTASRSTRSPAALETQAATAVPLPNSLMKSR